MEATVTETTPPDEAPEEEPVTEDSPAKRRSPQELFKYSDWCHVGPGAEECEGGENGACDNPLHFHAWCRLPNQFQHESIKEKASAAKARRIRSYRDAESDASAVLDGHLDEIEYTMGNEAARNTYIEEIVYKDFMRDYFSVIEEMREEEGEEDEPGPWVHIDEDKERMAALSAMSEDERPGDEYSELKSHLDEYNNEIERRVKEVKQEPVRQSLQGRDMDELRSMVREERVQKDAQARYMTTYTLWEQYIGTLKPQPQGIPAAKPEVAERMFKSVEHLKAAAPEVVEALDAIFNSLDGEFGATLTAEATGKG